MTRQSSEDVAMNREGGILSAIFGQGWAGTITQSPVLLILWWLAILHTVILAVNLPRRVFRHDFSVFYSSAIALRHHLDPYVVDLVPIGQRMGMRIWPLIHTTDTPIALLLFMPFSLVAPGTAHAIWIALNGAALVAALLLLIRPKYSGMDTRMALAVAALALLYAPITENSLFGQRQTIILLLLVMVMRSLQRGREATAGMLLAVAVAYRIFPLLVAGYFIVRRQWRPLLYMAFGLAIVGAVTIAAIGLPVCLSYSHGMRLAMSATSDPSDVAIRGVIIRSFARMFGDHLDSRIEILQVTTVLCAQLTILGLTVWPALRQPRPPVFDHPAYCLWVAAAVVLSPLSWTHYMILLLIPLIAIAVTAGRHQCSRRAFYAAATSYLLIAVAMNLRKSVVGADWWAYGVRYTAEASSVALLIGFLAAYWFAADTTDLEDLKRWGQAPMAFAPSDHFHTQIDPLRSALP